jgi:hypothetical protein
VQADGLGGGTRDRGTGEQGHCRQGHDERADGDERQTGADTTTTTQSIH